MARPRTHHAEYERRIARAQAARITRRVARGHGPVPIRIAKGIEKERGGDRPLRSKTYAKYRKGIAEYERSRYGELVTGRVVGAKRTGRPVPRLFRSRKQAEAYLDERVPGVKAYATIRQGSDGKWTITLPRR